MSRDAKTVRIRHPLGANCEVASEELWDFPEGLIGLPDLRRFALVPLENCAPFELLCSVEAGEFGLVLVEPTLFVPDYTLALPAADLKPLSVRDSAQLQIRVPVVLPEPQRPVTLNLKGPLILSPRERRGVQRISPEESHAIRHALHPSDLSTAKCSS